MSSSPAARRRGLPLVDAEPIGGVVPRPSYAIWEVTLRCDLSCHHCSSRAGRARADELTTEEALDLVDQLADLGVLEVTLIGGEVYLRDDWVAIVRAVRARGMECTLVTGGRGMTHDRALAAKDAGLMSASVSVDGLAATHDALRGLAGSHEAAMRAMARLSGAGVQVSANTQIGRRNRRELAGVFAATRDAGAHSWQAQLTVPAGRAADDAAIVLEPYHLIEVMPSVARIKAQADAAGVHIWPGNNLGYFGPYEGLLRGHLPGGRRGSCGAGRFSIGIESDGCIKGCPSLPSGAYVGGSIRDHRLRDIWARAGAIAFTRGDRLPELWGYCAGCYYADDCLAGCSWTAHSILGRRGNNPLCHHRALDLLRRGRRERLVRVASAPGDSFDHALFELVEEDWPAAERARAEDVVRGIALWLLDEVPY